LLLLVAVAGAGCGEAHRDSTPPVDPLTLKLLPRQPALPRRNKRPDPGLDDWQRTAGWGLIRHGDVCKGGAGAAREWLSTGGETVFVRVCVLDSERRAHDVYDSESLADLDLGNSPNFEDGTPTDLIVPSDVASLESLAADEQEIACGVGAADHGCANWSFQGRSSRVVWFVQFEGWPDGITFQEIRAVIRSVDRVIAANAPA
jgi:hypothetical protein